jgi:DNA-binding NarL/FixJ family response regulator
VAPARGPRGDARKQLRAAHASFTRWASGGSPIGPPAGADGQLTAQEAHIVRLVVEGRTNPEIAPPFFISTRTVEWHLRRILAKVGVRSRRELGRVIARPG